MSQAEDLILVGQVTLLGSRRAFDTLVRKYQGDVRRLLLNLTGGDADLAADIAQDTFLKAGCTSVRTRANPASAPGSFPLRTTYSTTTQPPAASMPTAICRNVNII